ncbi:MAG: type II secretion system F family protein [Acutalibacteraceae bacterium]|nr:type II secretion system F family protein [Clostridia bacterium]MDO4406799.1 hypothetical protein [Eubacteriales bacterium]MEE3312354.1 type II secretion system F family protein [Acutalibacteraceae bacterium]
MKRPRIRARSASGGQTPAEDSRLKNRTRTIPTISFEKYCGKTYGVRDLSVGFLGGFAGGLATGFLLFGHPVPELVLAVLFGWYFRGAWVRHKVEKRKRDFLDQFCDYLDSIATSLAVGRNGYEAFLTADDDMKELYEKGAPIRYASGRLTEGLKNGRAIPDLLREMAEETDCSSVRTFGEIYQICSTAGGNLKHIVGDTRNMIIEKIAIEQEIQTVLTGPKNELNIMVLMPLVILASLRVLGGGIITDDSSSMLVNTIALGIFGGSYWLGRKIVDIRV